MRLLAVDFGFTRIGLAVGETDPPVASSRPFLKASGALKRDAEAIGTVAKKEEAEKILVGLPLEDEEVEGRMARICRTLAGHLTESGWGVEMVDERLSSVEANRMMMDAGLKASQRRKHVDGEAAIIILERYLHEAATP